MSLKQIYYIFFLFSALIFYSCILTKDIPDGKYLLDKVTIKSDIHEYKIKKLKSYIKQQPNSKIFGVFKIKLCLYNLLKYNNTKIINHLILKLVEAPIIFDSISVKETEIELKKLLINSGYLYPNVFSKCFFYDKKVHIIYYTYGNTPYYVNSYDICIKDPSISKELKEKIRNEDPHLNLSFIKSGILFNYNLLDTERERIATLLQNRGYFKFSKENLIYTADSISNKINLKLKLKFSKNDIDSNKNKKFYYDSVFIYTNYDPLKITDFNFYNQKDSVVKGRYTIYYTSNKFYLNPKILLNNCFIEPTKPYSQFREELTSTSIMSLNSLSNVRIQLYEKIRNDSNLLDCRIFTMPISTRTISFDIEGTNTSGNFGIASSFNYNHRNIFKGSELFSLHFREAYKNISDPLNSHFELNTRFSIYIPMIILNNINNSFLKYSTSANIFINYNYLTQSEYNHSLLSSAIQFQWKKRLNPKVIQYLNLLNIDYSPCTTNKNKKNIHNTKQFNYNSNDKLIMGTNYSISSSSFFNHYMKNKHKFRLFFESAGNTFFLFNSLFNLKTPNFAQFIKFEINFSKKIYVNPFNTFSYYIESGIAVPYGNSQTLPLEKKYSSGGANGVRAWKDGELGPGAFKSDFSPIHKRTGDIKLDFKVEYRTNFLWRLELASFIDAGNIWTIKKDTEQKNGAFLFNSFFKQIAVGYGLGLRINFDYFILRLDCAEKAYDPTKIENCPVVLFRPNFKDNFAWYLTVGYPF
ncbi:MAG: BamA/TamA family outer membrane protein [Bacteroidales bacterium OttesenSCG-928-I14]|jgi:outer membrane protein assembly factor BamA|nr:BamA/TamA family outer membrane protein [Bacteroidales bacterium OttesenSCG-928-I14]